MVHLCLPFRYKLLSIDRASVNYYAYISRDEVQRTNIENLFGHASGRYP